MMQSISSTVSVVSSPNIRVIFLVKLLLIAFLCVKLILINEFYEAVMDADCQHIIIQALRQGRQSG